MTLRRHTVSARILSERLGLILDWYKGMVSEQTGRLLYTYEPEGEIAIADGSPIRDIASVWDVALLSRFLGRSDLLPLIERSLRHYRGYLIPRDGSLILDPARLGEPSGIAHSAFMILALLDSGSSTDRSEVVPLAEGLLRQQRTNGSYAIYFADEADDGLEFYPGEAMLALMRTYAFSPEARYLTSVEHGFAHYSARFPVNAVAPALLAFYANWQSQYAAVLHEHTRSDALRGVIRQYVCALHDRIIAAGFYEDIERHPMRQATVQVACALEGLDDAYAIAAREQDHDHVQSYARCIQVALAWLLGAQRLERCTPRERGGFGHSLADRTQRIDVTGHVLGGFMKAAENRVGE